MEGADFPCLTAVIRQDERWKQPPPSLPRAIPVTEGAGAAPTAVIQISSGLLPAASLRSVGEFPVRPPPAAAGRALCRPRPTARVRYRLGVPSGRRTGTPATLR